MDKDLEDLLKDFADTEASFGPHRRVNKGEEVDPKDVSITTDVRGGIIPVVPERTYGRGGERL